MIMFRIGNPWIVIADISSFIRPMVVNPYHRDFHTVKKLLLNIGNVHNENFVGIVFLYFSCEKISYSGRCLDYYSMPFPLVTIQKKKRAQPILVIIKKEQRIPALIKVFSYLFELLF